MSNQTTNLLFNPLTLNDALSSFSFPLDLKARHQKIQGWIAQLKSGALKYRTEAQHANFIKELFQGVLGYSSIAQGKNRLREIHTEQLLAVGGGCVDGALGFFKWQSNPQGKRKLLGKVVACIQLTGAEDNLDSPRLGAKNSLVEEGWLYAKNTISCRWIIVSNYREIRLYHASKSLACYQKFLLKDLANWQEFQLFFFLLYRQNFLPQKQLSKKRSVIAQLLAKSDKDLTKITKQIYSECQAVRLGIVECFRQQEIPDVPNVNQLLIDKSQELLNRVLFIAFCEAQGLLPDKTFQRAHRRKYLPSQPIWDNYKLVFSWVRKGNNYPLIPSYDCALFDHDYLLDEQLIISDPLCNQLKLLTRFDFNAEVSPDVLGYIFEQSVTDLEQLEADYAGEDYDRKKGQRKSQGIFYTPAFVTQYMVELALGGYLKGREQEFRNIFQLKPCPERDIEQQKDAEIKFWKIYLDEVLKNIRVIDPACGSGAFLIAAFDYLLQEYQRVNYALESLTGEQLNISELKKTILQRNLFGVDLSPESVEITKIALWFKAAEWGTSFAGLAENIKVGNALVDDPKVDEKAFNWQVEFAEVFDSGRFDVVVGNPPYVRQILLSHLKPYLRANYKYYDGMADLYTYFYERGLKILKPGGVLSYIVPNQWLRSGYGKPLRRLFSFKSEFERIIDFGDSTVFEDAITLSCIVLLRKPLPPTRLLGQFSIKGVKEDKFKQKSPVIVCSIPRQKLAKINLRQYVQRHSYEIPWSRFSTDAWRLENHEVEQLVQKIISKGVPLSNFAEVRPYRGVLSGFNELFVLDETTKNRLIKADPKAAEIIKPFLFSPDIKRWNHHQPSFWIILLKSSVNYDWPWSAASSPKEAEHIFQQTYPSIYQHLKPYEKQLRERTQRYIHWWELRPCSYYDAFTGTKIIYPDIQAFPGYAIDFDGHFTNNSVYLIAKADLYLCGCLNSPLAWWISQRLFPKMVGDTVSPGTGLMMTFPIASPTEEIRAEVEAIVSRLITISKANYQAYANSLGFIQGECQIEKLGRKLEDFATLSFQEFIEEVKQRVSKTGFSDTLNRSDYKTLHQLYQEYAPAIATRKAEAVNLEHRLADLINQAYQLTPEDIELLWKTAPPRMPISPTGLTN
ncbi:MAG: DNA methyltransferase [Coleofasciculaceae cyanobacterium]